MNICFCWRKHSLKVYLYFIKILLMNRRPIDQSRCQAPPPETKSDNPHVKFGKLSGYPFSDVPDCSLAHSHWHQHCHEDTKVIIIVIIVIILMLPSESILTPPAYAVRLEPIYLLEGAISENFSVWKQLSFYHILWGTTGNQGLLFLPFVGIEEEMGGRNHKP